MQQSRWVVLGAVVAGAFASLAGCGDDETSSSSSGGGGGGGGATTTTTTTTTTTSSSAGGAGGDGGTGGEGGAPPSFADSCPGGELATLQHGVSLTVNGSTNGATDTFSTFCGDTLAGGADVPDQVLEILITQSCSMTFELQSTWDAVLSLRNEGYCSDRTAGQSLCLNRRPTVESGTGELLRRHMPSGRYHLVVDGAAAGAQGDFSLLLDCKAPTCGDGVLNPGEQCDYGPDVPNDGCSATCTSEAQTAGENCSAPTVIGIEPGQEQFWPPAPPLYSTAAAAHDYQGASCGEDFGKDQVFAVTPTADGTLSITVGENYQKQPYCQNFTEPECWDHPVYVREGNCTSGQQLTCALTDFDTGVTVATVPVTGGTTYYVFVDGYINQPWAQGPYVMRLNHTPN